MDVGHGSKEDLPGDPFHLLDGFPEFAFIFHRLFEGLKLFRVQRDGDGFASDFACPLVTAARGSEVGTIQHGALADVTDFSQAFAQAIVLTLQGAGSKEGFFHDADFKLDVKC